MNRKKTFAQICIDVWREVPVHPTDFARVHPRECGTPNGERAAQRDSDERHLRMVPRHDKDARFAGIARYEGRSKKRLFSRPPFTPRFMRKDSAIVSPAPKPVIVKPVLVTGVSPVTEVYQQELRETCRRFGRTTRFATESPLATRPRQPWKLTPLRPPVALCASGSVLYVDSRVM